MLVTMEEREEVADQVGHCKKDECDVYIGRGYDGEDILNRDLNPFSRGYFGNPHTLEECSRAEAVEKFEEDLARRVLEDAEFAAAVASLDGKVLGCWCREQESDVRAREKPCHGDILAAWAVRLSD